VTIKEAESKTWEPRSVPGGRIQWKGTSVCIDVTCGCGHDAHLDAEFAYYWKCSQCGRVWALDPHVALIPVGGEPEECIVGDGE
jgi:hypothetical protein